MQLNLSNEIMNIWIESVSQKRFTSSQFDGGHVLVLLVAHLADHRLRPTPPLKAELMGAPSDGGVEQGV